jgi:hypothetical protein
VEQDSFFSLSAFLPGDAGFDFALAQQEGFVVTDHPAIRLSHLVVLTKPSKSR